MVNRIAIGACGLATALVIAGCFPRPPVLEGFVDLATRTERMSKAEFSDYARGFIGRPVHWDGWVKDMRRKPDGTFDLLVSALPLDVKGQPRAYVLPVSQAEGERDRKGHRIAFQAVIRRFDMLFTPTIEFENVQLL